MEIDSFHNQEHIKSIIRLVLNEFSPIDKKVYYVTDNGRNLVSALKNEERIECEAHLMHNFVVRDLIKVDKEFLRMVKTCRQIVHFLRTKNILIDEYYGNDACKIDKLDKDLKNVENEFAFEREYGLISEEDQDLDLSTEVKEHAENEVGINDMNNPKKIKKLKRDVITRWSSIYTMINSVLEHQDCIMFVASKTMIKDLMFEEDDWQKLKGYFDLLAEFKMITDEICARDKPTSNLVLFNRLNLKHKLNSSPLFNQSQRITILELFDKRFKTHDLHVLCSLLDPMYKNLSMINNYLKDKNLSEKEFIISFSKKFDIKFNKKEGDNLNHNEKRLLVNLFSDDHDQTSLNVKIQIK